MLPQFSTPLCFECVAHLRPAKCMPQNSKMSLFGNIFQENKEYDQYMALNLLKYYYKR